MSFSYSRLEKLVLFFFLASLLLLSRLFYWQIISGYDLASAAVSMRAQEIPINIARGDIMDKSGIPLTNTAVQYSIFVFPGQVKNIAEATDDLSTIVLLPDKEREEMAKKNRKSPPFRLLNGLDSAVAQKVSGLNLQGVVVMAENRRYDNNSLAAHIVGYTNLADNRGVSGVESICDELLLGSDAEYVAAMVDAGQSLIPGLGYKKIRTGSSGSVAHNVVLTIDKPTQQAVEKIMDRSIAKGAVIVQKAATGEILAMASRPNFDANNLGEYLLPKGDRYQDSSPLLNRALAAYQPGSVFKLVVAAAALENKTAKLDDVFYDPGYIDVSQTRFWAWDYENGARGKINFTEALAYSSNPVFIRAALNTGGKNIIETAEKMGFGSHSTLGLGGEMKGNLPEAQELYPGDLANLAIGQGLCEATPLQIAQCTAIIANGGIKVDPYLISAIRTSDGNLVKNFQKSSQSAGQRVISEQTAAALQKMMAAVTRYGTGRAAYLASFGSAGKTGSAETGRTDTSGQGVSHAWFTGYTPLETPKYVIVVFVEDGMSGGDVAAPIFREIAAEVMRLKP